MSVFTRENFSYTKILSVIFTGLCFLGIGIVFESEKGLFVGPPIILIGVIYLSCRFFVDKRTKDDSSSQLKVEFNFHTILRDLQDDNFDRRNIAFDLFHGFGDRLANGSCHEAPLEELEQEYKRLGKMYKEADQRMRQIEVLEKDHKRVKRVLSRQERKKYRSALNAIESTTRTAQPEQSARNRLVGKVHRARKRLEIATEPKEIELSETSLQELELAFSENRKTGRNFIRLADQAKADFELLKYSLLDKWVLPDTVGYDPVVDCPMPHPAKPQS